MGDTTRHQELIRLLVLCRTERKLSLAKAAKAIGISTPALSGIERGYSKPRRTTHVLIENFLRKHGYFLKSEVA